MARLFYKSLCTLFLVSYVFNCFGMEDLPDKVRQEVKKKLETIRSNYSENVPYDISVNEYADGCYEVSAKPILTQDQALKSVPFAESFDQLEINPQSATIKPSQPRSNDQSKAPYPPHNNSTQSNNITDMRAQNKREEEHKNALQRGQSPINPLMAPPSPGGIISYDSDTLEAAIEYNRKQANQGRNKKKTAPKSPSEREKYVLELEEKRKQNIRKNLYDMISSNYDNEVFMEALEKNAQNRGSHNDYLEARQFFDNHPEMIKGRNHSTFESPSKRKIESKVFSSTFNTLVKKSDEYESSAEKFDKKSSGLANDGQKENKFSKEAKRSFEKLKEIHTAQKEKKKLEEGIQIGRKVIAKRKEEQGKSSQARPTDTPVSYHQAEQTSIMKDRMRVLKNLEKELKQHNQNNTYQQQHNYPRKDFYDSGNYNNRAPKSTRQRHSISDFEREMARSGFKSKKMQENDAIDAEERRLAQIQAADEEPWPTREERLQERAYYQQLDSHQKLFQWQFNEVNKILSFGVLSEFHKNALNEAWSNAINKANNGLLSKYNHAYCAHLRGTKYFEQCMNTRWRFHGDYNKIDPNDLRYFPIYQEFLKEAEKILQDYAHWEKFEYLPQLRNQPDKDNLRRNLEFKHFNSEDFRNFRILEKQLNAQYDEQYKQLPFGVSFWEYTIGWFSSEKSSKQILYEEHKKMGEKVIEDFIDRISARNKKIQEAQEGLEKEKENNNQDTSQLMASPSARVSTNDWLAESDNQDSVDYVITIKSDKFLKKIGVDPDEFNNFKGETPEQIEIHSQLVDFINTKTNDPIWDFIQNNDSELATKIREIHENVFKAAHALNSGNFTDLAQEMVLFLVNFSTFSVFPIRTIALKCALTMLHPKEYAQERLNNFYQLAQIVAEFGISIEPLLFNPSATESLTIIKNGLDKGAHIISKMIQDNFRLTLREREKLLAEQFVDLIVDGTITGAVGKMAKISAGMKKIPGHLPYIDATIEPIGPRSWTPGELSNQLRNPEVIKALEETKTIIAENIRKAPHYPMVIQPPPAPSAIPTIATVGSSMEKVAPALAETEKPGVYEKSSIDIVLLRNELNNGIAHLEKQYDPAVVQEASTILKLDNDRVLVKMKDPVALLESTTEDLAKIDSNPRWKTLRFDPAEGMKCKHKNIEEALAGIACEEQGLLKGLIRDIREKGGEFIDSSGQVWDVKTAKSYSLSGEYIFDNEGLKYFFESVRKELKSDENIIINTTNLQALDHAKLYEKIKTLSTAELQRIIIIDAANPVNSKTTNELIKFLNI